MKSSRNSPTMLPGEIDRLYEMARRVVAGVSLDRVAGIGVSVEVVRSRLGLVEWDIVSLLMVSADDPERQWSHIFAALRRAHLRQRLAELFALLDQTKE